MKQNLLFVQKVTMLALVTLCLHSQAIAQALPELLYYKFDGTGTAVPNYASAPPTGTSTATIMGSITQDTTGQCAGALIGSGISASSDYLNTGFATDFGTGSWTISMWTKDITPSSTLFYIFGDANAGSFRCFTNGVAGPNNWILRGAFTDVLVNGGATVAPHVTTFVYDQAAGNIYAYLDGVLVNTVAQTGFTVSGAGPFKVMGYSTNVGAPVGGKLDEFRLYNRALSATEVMQLTGVPSVYSSFSVSACGNYTVPSGDTTYTNSGTYYDTIPSIGGCGDSVMTINLTINNLPAVMANASSMAVCAGSSLTLSGSGAVSYTWDNSVVDNAAFVPAASSDYIVTGTDGNGCHSNDTISIVVNPLPTVVANTTASSVCAGSSVTLSGSGAVSYTWDNSVVDNAAFSPSATMDYIVTGTDANSCQNMDTVTVTVNALPTVQANAVDTAVCAGTTTLLYGSGAVSYTWTGSVADSVSFAPSTTDTYTVTGTDANGCQNTDMIAVTVHDLPVITMPSLPDSVCTTAASFTLVGQTPTGGTWTGSGVSGTSFDPAAAGIGNAVLTYSYSDTVGCSSAASDTINVKDCTGIISFSQNNNFSVYPNPTDGQFTVLINSASFTSAQVEVVDCVGKTVVAYSTSNPQSSVDLSALANGVYFVKVRLGETSSVRLVTKH